MITKEYLEQKVAQLKTQHEQLQGNLIATSGAIQLAEQLLNVLAAAETPPE